MRCKLLTKISQSIMQVFDYLAVDFPIKIQKIKSASSNYNSFLFTFLLSFLLIFLGKKKTLFHYSYKQK